MTTLPLKMIDLPYDRDALEPHIDRATMCYHYKNHYWGYYSKFVNALKEIGIGASEIDLEFFYRIDDLDIEDSYKQLLKNNWGGRWNHSMFWQWMSPSAKLGTAFKKILENEFWSEESFRDKFLSAAMGRFGSWWAWLVKKDERLVIYSTPNQDNPLMRWDFQVLLGVDVWEHAYYLKYQFRRDEYLRNWWNTINWERVEQLWNGYEGF